MLHDIIKARIELIEKISSTFKLEIEPTLPKRFLRGPLQKQILKKYNLPVTGPYMRIINEALAKLGYKKIYIDGWSYYKKVG